MKKHCFLLILCLAFNLASSLSAFAIEGSYQITSSKTLGGQSYKGDVVIKKIGEVYSVSWLLAGSGAQYGGIGVLDKNVLSVAFGNAATVGVVSYRVEGKKLTGIWTALGATSTGSEVLELK